MADSALIARSALAGIATAGRHGRTGGPAGVVICEIHGAAMATIVARKGRTGDVMAALARVFDIALEDKPRRIAAGGIAISGTAPGQWLAVAEGARAATFVGDLTGALDGLASVCAQGDGRVALLVSGLRARDALAKGVPIDLHPQAFPPGHVAQTAAGHIGLQIAARDDAPTFELIVAPSVAGSFWHWLIASAAEFGVDVG